MSAPLFRIKDWDQHFENNRTRDLKELRFVYFPNKHDGDGYTQLVDHPDGMAHFGAWCLIVQIASRCNPRGTLIRAGGIPHDAVSMARRTSAQAQQFEAAIPRLLDPIGWLEIVSQAERSLLIQTPSQPSLLTNLPSNSAIPQVGATIPQVGATLLGLERSGSERIEGSVVEDHPAVKIYQKICGRPLNALQQIEVVNTVQDAQLYERVLIQFMLETRPVERVDWTLERYREQLPATTTIVAAESDHWQSLSEAEQQQECRDRLGYEEPSRKDDVMARGEKPAADNEVRRTGS